MTCSILFSREAAHDIDSVYRSDRKLFARIMKKVEFLESHPEEGKPLAGNHRGEFSLRVGNYRIVYQPDYAKHIIYVLTIKHRKHAY
jgi:mRNA interferase RelE/StbE